jgi:acetylglutamate kinase
LKLGGELLEDRARLKAVGDLIARVARTTPILVVHGGGREIDRALARAGIAKHQLDGLRVTDEATLEVVVSVLAGPVNTCLVSAVNAAGGAAVGLTGADGDVCPVVRAPRHRLANGDLIDLGLVGRPIASARPRLVRTLLADGFTPVVASIAAGRAGTLYNVNADTMAGHLAGRLRARRLVIAGSTQGVLDSDGQTMAVMDSAARKRAITSGSASAGMVAKLAACGDALARGVREVVIADGRRPLALAPLLTGAPGKPAAATRVTN